MTRPGSDIAPDEYDQEKEYDDRFIVAEIFNQTKPMQKKDIGLPMSIVIIAMFGAVLILIVIVIVSFSKYINHIRNIHFQNISNKHFSIIHFQHMVKCKFISFIRKFLFCRSIF